jgi:hypothetical protein
MPDLMLTLVKNQPLSAGDFVIVKPEGPHKAMAQVLRQAKNITAVESDAEARTAGIVASALQGLRKGLRANYDNEKAPILAGGRGLDQLFHDLDGPMEREYKRITGLYSGFADQKRLQADLQRARQEADIRAAVQAEEQRLADLERQRQTAELKAKLAEDPRERIETKRELAQLNSDVDEAKLRVEIQREEVPMERVPETPKPVGGRVYTDYEIDVEDAHLFARQYPELVEIVVKRGPTKERLRQLDEAGKSIQLAGLKVRKFTRSSFVGAASIRIEREKE